MNKSNCNICPRKCNIERERLVGFCGQTDDIYISKVMLHKFEEPCISGTDIFNPNVGSGAIFFSGCNLRCIYCQNYNISQTKHGKLITINTLANLFKQLESAGALNINLVTPTHYTNQIIEALKIYKPNIPIVWNSSGYESQDTLRKLDGLVDIFLLDMKYMDENISESLSFAKNYPNAAKNAILTARSIIPNDIFDEKGIMQKGVIVRHLVLPNLLENSKKVLNFIYKSLGPKTIISIMSQYVPMHKAINHPLIGRKLKPIEYKIIINHAKKLGFTNAYIQELTSSETIYTPDFSNQTPKFKY